MSRIHYLMELSIHHRNLATSVKTWYMSFIAHLNNNRFIIQIACNIVYNITPITTIPHKNNETNDKFYRKVAFPTYAEMVNFRPQSCKHLGNKNHTEDWELGCHPRDNRHVTK